MVHSWLTAEEASYKGTMKHGGAGRGGINNQISTLVPPWCNVCKTWFYSCILPSYQDALSLKERPFAHNTTLILVVAAILYLSSRLFPSMASHPLTGDLLAMFLVATLSHHLRDGDRRGLWFGPFFSTPPIPHKLYVFLVILLPTLTPLPALLPTMLRALVEMPRGLGVTRQRPSVVLDV